MALCLANSLIARRDFVPYDQLVRYKWWYRDGYMSSTGKCFDIGAATRQSLNKFERRQKEFAETHGISVKDVDFLSDARSLEKFDVDCSEDGVAGNGALMRLAPVPLFFYKEPAYAVKCSGRSGEITHGDRKAYDACRYYGALIVAAVNGATREQLLDNNFYDQHKKWFDSIPLHRDIMEIARGSYKKGGYEKGIRGKGYIVNSLEAALWAFWSSKESFEEGALAAVNLGEDTDTTAAIYGQLAGAYYGFENLSKEWVNKVYAKKFIECLSKWLVYEGNRWTLEKSHLVNVQPQSKPGSTRFHQPKANSNTQPYPEQNQNYGSKSSKIKQTTQTDSASTSRQCNDPNCHDRQRRHTIHDDNFTFQSNSHQQPVSARPTSAKPHDTTGASQRKLFQLLTKQRQKKVCVEIIV
jgi:ADP-ribosyl-[dinitrogen reductase] hydrolase